MLFPRVVSSARRLALTRSPFASIHRLPQAPRQYRGLAPLANQQRQQQRGFTTGKQDTATAEGEDAAAAAGSDSESVSAALQDEETADELRTVELSSDGVGTVSPWAVFDAWGAAGEIGGSAPNTKEEDLLLSKSSVEIPTDKKAFEAMRADSEILKAYDATLQRRSLQHFGYPYNLMYNHEELYEFMKYSINNLGDPFVPSNYGVHSRQFEVAVIDFFAKIWKAKEGDYWGYVTTCGTEGNLYGMLLARECHPDGVLYSSKETHYSIFKAARYYRMDAEAIPTLPMGEIDYDALGRALAKNKGRNAIINVNIGTTVKGAVDNLDRILRILAREGYSRDQYHIHCDGALFAMMLPFVEYAPEISFNKPIDSIAVSGHKMLGCPMPCGITITRKEHVKKVEQRIEYLNSVDTTIMGSRNGQAALYLWYSLRKKGVEGIKKDVTKCLETACYLRDKLTEAGILCRLNDLSTTVVLERPVDDGFVKRWQLACEQDIAHVVVMPNITESKIDVFVKELVSSVAEHGHIKTRDPSSPLSLLTSVAWGGTGIPGGGQVKANSTSIPGR